MYLMQSNLVNNLRDTIMISSASHNSKTSMKPEELSKLGNISLESAHKTLDNTTRRHLRLNKTSNAYRRYKTLAHQLQYRQLGRFLGKFASDIFHSKITSTRGNNYTTVFANRGNFTCFTPILVKSDANLALERFLSTVGIPVEILTDGIRELHKAAWGKLCNRYYISQLLTDSDPPWQNPTELQGGLIKYRVKNEMRSTNTHVRLWNYSWEFESSVRSLTATSHIITNGTIPFKKMYGYTPNISEHLPHG